MIDSKVMQATGNHHDQVRKTIFRVSQHIFHNARALDARNGMFDFDTNLRHLAIALFLFGGQLFLTWLFFG